MEDSIARRPMKKLIINFIISVDYLIILIKCSIAFIGIYEYVRLAKSSFQPYWLTYIYPFLIYGVINIIRIFLRKKWGILVVEGLLNIYFFFAGAGTAIFIIYTSVSIASIYFEHFLRRFYTKGSGVED